MNKKYVAVSVLFLVIVALISLFSPPAFTPSATVKTALAQADKSVKAADTKIAAATVQVKHAKAVVKVRVKAAAAKLAAYKEAKSPGSGGNPAAVGDMIVAPTPELPAPVEEVVAAADAALDASHDEVVALQDEVAALETVVDAHGEKADALENERELLTARAADLEKENARLENRLYWTHVAIGVAVAVAAAGGLYLIGVF